jgi:predicted DNA binding CopG/RHH family protein
MAELFELSQPEKQLRKSGNNYWSQIMKKEYDFSQMKSRRNPYASKLKRQVTIRIAEDVISYFKALAEDTGIPYQTLINLYLHDCMAQHRKPDLSWL